MEILCRPKPRRLRYDETLWEEVAVKPVSTLQLFITNRCNLRCRACFYAKQLGKEEMSMEEYERHIFSAIDSIDKAILLGGEPTLHNSLEEMLRINHNLGLRTTVYTNGAQLKRLEGINLRGTQLRIGVHSAISGEKPLSKVERTSLPVTVVYMLDPSNVGELTDAAKMAESDFNCNRFYVSSIRDISRTGSYWLDSDATITLEKYAEVVQGFVNTYKGKMELHIAKRGVLEGKYFREKTSTCRFGNVFPDGRKIICPLDISLGRYSGKLAFGKRQCNKNDSCLLTKIVLRRK